MQGGCRTPLKMRVGGFALPPQNLKGEGVLCPTFEKGGGGVVSWGAFVSSPL